MNKEVWKYMIVDGVRTDWMISSFGFIKDAEGNIIDQWINSGGYFSITYNREAYAVHRLVASNFIQKDLRGMHVHHLNHCPWDNRVENLEVLTPTEHQRVDALPIKVVHDIASEILANKLSPKEIAKKYNVGEHTVRAILHKKTYKDYLYDFDFSNYKFLRNPGNRGIIVEAVRLYEEGYTSKEVVKALSEKYGTLSMQKIYYFNAEAKKLVKNKDKTDARYKYKELFAPLDEMIMSGCKYEDLMQYLKENTNLSYDDSRYLVERRITNHKKVMRKFENK